MNPAEEIVKFWLQEKGYFIQSSIRVPNGYNREIDILAVHEKEGIKKHIEVSVSVRMQASNHSVATLAEHFVKKFDNARIVSEVQRRFFSDRHYEKVLVVGEVCIGGRNVIEEFTAECKKSGINVVPMSGVLKDVAAPLGGHTHLNPIIKTVQIVNKFLCSS